MRLPAPSMLHEGYIAAVNAVNSAHMQEFKHVQSKAILIFFVVLELFIGALPTSKVVLPFSAPGCT